jgi:predicted deacetylase
LAVHVSIHDVSPAFAQEVEEALALCHAAGARPSLLVVPDFHGRAPLAGSPAFCAKLRSLQAEGHEVFLHGLVHQSAARYGDGAGQGRLAWLLAQRVVSGGEAEMSDVSPVEGRARLDAGEAVLKKAGLRIDGYVPPAWSMPPWLVPVLASRGYRFTEDHLRVYDPVAGTSRPTLLLNWATRSPARLLSTLVFNRAARHARGVWPARVAIHPADLHVLVVRREIQRMLAWARGDFVARGRELLPD